MVVRPSIFGLLALLAIASPTEAQPAVRHVLILRSYHYDFEPQASAMRNFRADLSRLSATPIEFFDVALQPAPSVEATESDAVANYLRSTLRGQRPDLIVTMSAPAAAFAQQRRAELFPSTPVLLMGLDRRWLQANLSPDSVAAVPLDVSLRQIVEGFLRVVPDTTNLFVVVGHSALEEAWVREITHDLEPLAGRITLVQFNDLSFADMLTRSAALPPHSAIFYLMMSVDALGVSQTEARAMAELHRTANAPMFGWHSGQLGQGIVGGPLFSVEEIGETAAQAAIRILNGESPANIPTNPVAIAAPAYDWRELQRWAIREDRLPPGSTILFRPQTVWHQYRSYIVAAAVIVGLQTALIGGLIVQLVTRRRAELALRQASDQNHDLAGRLIGAQDAERARIARDLHDDVSQRLAGVSISFSGLKRRLGESRVAADVQDELADLQQQTLTLARNLRHLSHDLHPTVLQHLGLAKGLTSYCGEIERAHGMTVTCTADGDFVSIPPEAALCVYRIAQEALRNVVAHAGASRADVHLARTDTHIEFKITDDGRGFDASHSREKVRGLGLVSMSERARIIGGTVTIVAGVDQGTCVRASIPVSARPTPATSGAAGQVA